MERKHYFNSSLLRMLRLLRSLFDAHSRARASLQSFVDEVLELCDLAVLVTYAHVPQDHLQLSLDPLRLVLRPRIKTNHPRASIVSHCRICRERGREGEGGRGRERKRERERAYRFALELVDGAPGVLCLVHLHLKPLPIVNVPNVLESAQRLEPAHSELPARSVARSHRWQFVSIVVRHGRGGRERPRQPLARVFLGANAATHPKVSLSTPMSLEIMRSGLSTKERPRIGSTASSISDALPIPFSSTALPLTVMTHFSFML